MPYQGPVCPVPIRPLSLRCHGVIPPLAPWGVDERSERLYRVILRHPHRTADELARILDWESSEVTETARALLRVRLIRITDTGVYVAPPPNASIEGLVSAEQQRLEQRQRQIHAARAAVSDFATEHLTGQAERWTPMPVDVVSGAESIAVLEDLSRTTSGDIVSFVRRSRHRHFPYLVEVGSRVLAEGRAMRTVYPMTALDDEFELEAIRLWVARGEQARIAPQIPVRLVVFGDEAALIDASYDKDSDTELVLRTPAIVAALRELFERVWTRSVTVPRLGVQADDDGLKRILELLALGAKDETVARNLGVSLRTVRRRVADLLDELGATTRFQAGMEAVRRGWV